MHLFTYGIYNMPLMMSKCETERRALHLERALHEEIIFYPSEADTAIPMSESNIILQLDV